LYGKYHPATYICSSCDLWPTLSFGSQSMNRPLAASAATGSLSSVLLWVLQESLRRTPIITEVPSLPPPLDIQQCPTLEPPTTDFWIGLCIGFVIWPLIELLVLLKQWLVLVLRQRLTSGFGGGDGKLYRVLA